VDSYRGYVCTRQGGEEWRCKSGVEVSFLELLSYTYLMA
jgi:hypothetical protein